MKKLLVGLICLSLFLLPLLVIKQQKKQTIQVENDCEIFINVNEENMPLESYLIGVLAGEMPVSFHIEALKAQAIAARTYAIYQTNYGEKAIQASTRHQVYETEEQRKEKWQTVFLQYESKVTQAVNETAGLIITYKDEPISAMFHASSDNMTESANNYSGQAISYLQAVNSPESVEPIVVELSYKRFNAKLGTQFSKSDLQRISIEKNNTNRVGKITIAGQSWTGRQFRDLLNLRSTNFTVNSEGDSVVITSKGYGHGVGMSQYGADEMAQKGSEAPEIISHYYQSTKLQKLACK